MKCSICHEDNSKSARFCVSCGNPLYLRPFCPACNRIVEKHSSQYCSVCGSKLEIFNPALEELMPFENEDGYWGFVSGFDGRVYIKPIYRRAFGFDEQYAVVENTKGMYGVIDKKGKIVVSFSFPLIRPIHHAPAGFFIFGNTGKYGIIDINENVLISPSYDDISGFEEDYLKVTLDGTCGIIKMDGTEVIPLGRYRYIWGSSKARLLAVVKDGKIGFADMTGKEVVPPKYDKGHPLWHSGDKAEVEREGSKFLIDEFGIECLPTLGVEERTGYVDNGVVVSYRGDKLVVSCKNALPLVEQVVDEIGWFSDNGYSWCRIDDKFGIMNANTGQVSLLDYQEIWDTDEDDSRYYAKRNGMTGLLSEDGTVLIECRYKELLCCGDNTYAACNKDDKWGLVDDRGKEITSFIYDSYDEYESYDSDWNYPCFKVGEKEVVLNCVGIQILPVLTSLSNESSLSNMSLDQSNEERCHVYLMVDMNNGFHKIGISKHPEYRERTLQSEKPTIELIASKEYPSRLIATSIESALHKAFAEKRIRGEWFQLSEMDVEQVIATLR